jgi:GT2 family glycosyltransferase
MRIPDDPRSPLPTIVLATRDRRERVLATLARLDELAERPRVVVVDDASTDGTASAVRGRFPDVTVIASRQDIGSAARTVGVEAAETPLVAFSDDDSWWAPGALRRAVEVFDAYPRLGLIAARILVEPDGRLDPTCAAMRDSPLPSDMQLPGPPVLGFLACGAVARRSAVLACGGFHARFGFGGEEHLLAVDMAAAG